MKKSKIPDHPYAQLFPIMDRPDLEDLARRIARIGQLEHGIVLDGKLLDGRNRQEACNIAGVQFTTVDWKELPESLTKHGPFEYVMSRNFDRRQMTKSQKAIVAAEGMKMRESEEREVVDAVPQLQQGDELSQDNGHDDADESQVRKRGRGRPKGSGKKAAAAAKQAGVSTRMVESASKLLKKSPKKAALVKAGKLTLSKAEKDDRKEAAAAAKLEAAYKRIASVCGKTLAQAARDGTRLKNRKEVLAFVEMDDADMKRTQGLIEDGWSVKRARLFRTTSLTTKHKIDDLLNRAIAGRGKFETKISGFTITVKRDKGKAADA